MKAEQTVLELASRFGVHPTPNDILGSISGQKALLEAALELFEPGSSAKEPVVDEAKVDTLHAKLGELTVTNDYLPKEP